MKQADRVCGQLQAIVRVVKLRRNRMNEDNKKLGYIEGGRFENIKAGNDRNATIAEIKMPDGFTLSARPVIILEIDEWDKIKNKINKLKA